MTLNFSQWQLRMSQSWQTNTTLNPLHSNSVRRSALLLLRTLKLDMHVFLQLKFSWYNFGDHGIICSVRWHDWGKVIHCKPENCAWEGVGKDAWWLTLFEQNILQARSAPHWVTRRGGSISKLRTWWNHYHSLHHQLQSRWFQSACKLVSSIRCKY